MPYTAEWAYRAGDVPLNANLKQRQLVSLQIISLQHVYQNVVMELLQAASKAITTLKWSDATMPIPNDDQLISLLLILL